MSRSKLQNDFLSVIRYELLEIKPSDSITVNDSLLSLARHHDLIHLVADCLSKHDSGHLPSSDAILYSAYLRDTNRSEVIGQLKTLFNENKIDFILLKGAVIKDYYPESWMRTSSDVDILVRREFFDTAAELLESNRFRFLSSCAHHHVYETESGLHVELHSALMDADDDRAFSSVPILEKVWDCSYRSEDCEYRMNDEFFYFFHIVHTLKHFVVAGCGIRNFVDLYYLNRLPHDEQKRSALLRQGGLEKFAETASFLSDCWMTDKPADGFEDVEQYVFKSGIYGTTENRTASDVSKTGNKASYLLKRAFMPYKNMKQTYKILDKAPFLLPACWVLRWFKIFKPKVRATAAAELKYMSPDKNTEIDSVDVLLKKSGAR